MERLVPDCCEQWNQGALAGVAATLVRRAERGDQSTLPHLRQLLNERADLWQQYWDLSDLAQASLVKLAGGSNLMLTESLTRKVRHLQDELAGPAPSPLERLLAERVATCWLQITYWDCQAAQASGTDRARLDAIRRHQDSAHKRFEAAAKNLATVRKLLAPTHSPIEVATRLEADKGAPMVRRGGLHAASTATN